MSRLTKLITFKWEHLSILVYVISAIALLMVDIIISKYASDIVVSDWAKLKSSMMILGPAMLFGANNLIVRYPHKILEITKFCIIAVFSICVALILANFFFSSIPLYIVLASAFYALTIFISSILRANSKFLKSQVSQNMWKIALLVTILVLSSLRIEEYSIRIVALINLLLPLLFVLLFYSKHPQLDIKRIASSALVNKDDFLFSIKFMISVFTAACSAYLEVYIVSNFSDAGGTAIFFRHYSLFTAVAVFFSGYVGFVLTPLIRTSEQKWGKLINTVDFRLPLASVILVFLSSSLLYFFFPIFYKEEVNYLLFWMMSGIALLRVVYVYPTSYMGATADAKNLDGFLLCGIVGVLLFVGVFFFLRMMGHSALTAAVFGSLANWLVRTVGAYYYSRRIYNFR